MLTRDPPDPPRRRAHLEPRQLRRITAGITIRTPRILRFLPGLGIFFIFIPPKTLDVPIVSLILASH